MRPATCPARTSTAQVAGATLGALTLHAVWTDEPAALGATVPSVGAGSAFVYELMLTAARRLRVQLITRLVLCMRR